VFLVQKHFHQYPIISKAVEHPNSVMYLKRCLLYTLANLDDGSPRLQRAVKKVQKMSKILLAPLVCKEHLL